MKIKRYIGNDTHEAIRKVKADLGKEAVILNTRKVRQKGFLKLFSKPLIEILAAVEEGTQHRESQMEKKANPIPLAVQNTLSKEKEEKINQLENKVSKMEGLLEKVYEQLQTMKPIDLTGQPASLEDSSKKVLDLFYNNMVKNEVDTDIAKEIMEEVKSKLGNVINMNDVAAHTYGKIQEILGKPETIQVRNDGKPTVVAFIGPTGVGKTTTIAKIAADFALNHKKSVGFITADTYRIAAVEQLKTYAEILGMPVSVVYSANEIIDAIEAYHDKDIVLIDTAGRSTKNRTQFDELKTLVKAANADEVFLVLSSTTSVKNVKDIIQNYCFLDQYKIIFTKLDETPVTGIILNVRKLTQKSLSYLTTGQSVPDDIEVANTDKLTKYLIGSIAK